MTAMLESAVGRIRASFPRLATDPLLVVDIGTQRLHFMQNGRSVREWPVSTAANGIGGEEGSQRTPPGLHRIRRKIGGGLPSGTVLKGRVAVAGEAVASRGDDLITSRILWLEGLEPGVNRGVGCDTFDRYIYIHGTADEGALATPVSHGCIRMRNADVIELYGLVERGTLVMIG